MELEAVERNSLQLLQISISVVRPLMPLIIAKQVIQHSWIIQPHLQSFHAFSDHPKADINDVKSRPTPGHHSSKLNLCLRYQEYAKVQTPVSPSDSLITMLE